MSKTKQDPWLQRALEDNRFAKQLAGAFRPRTERPNWDEYALILAFAATFRSEDPFHKVGACALRHDNSIAGLGYNGALPGEEMDWSDRDARREHVIHAELNCLAYCRPGECRLLACTISPCNECLKQIARYGIKRVIYAQEYEKDKAAVRNAKLRGIEMIQIDFSPAAQLPGPSGS